MVFSCKKCIDIQKVTSGGRAEMANLKLCHFSHFQFHQCHQRSLLQCHCAFYIYGLLVKKLSLRFLKDTLLTELSPRMSSSVSFWHLQDILGDNSANRAFASSALPPDVIYKKSLFFLHRSTMWSFGSILGGGKCFLHGCGFRSDTQNESHPAFKSLYRSNN